MPRIHIGEQVKELRKKAGMSQTALADFLGVHWRSVQDWEAGRTAVDTFKAEALLKMVEELVKKHDSEGEDQ